MIASAHMTQSTRSIKIVQGSIAREIGKSYPPFIIAEMSGNHNQSLERALQIVEAAAKSGAHALKLQTYTADSITLNKKDGEFFISDPNSLWKGRSLYDLYSEAYTPWEWHEPIFKRCQELGLICFSTPFDESAVDFLENLKVPCYKVASFENAHIPLIKKVAKTGKPLIVSTGMADLTVLNDLTHCVANAGNNNLILLKCTSSYPASPEDTNLNTIPHMMNLFNVQVGLSDHTMGVGAAVAAVALGATVIEKHFTLSRAEGGVDAAFSLEPDELKSLVIETERAWQALGRITYEPTEKEKKSMQLRRSIYVSDDIKSGEPFTTQNIKVVRPALGLEPKYYDLVLSSRAKRDIKGGTPLRLTDLES